jgi:hypothetical protein
MKMAKLYVYDKEYGICRDIITCETERECLAQFEATWESNDYEATFSPGLHAPEIGQKFVDMPEH